MRHLHEDHEMRDPKGTCYEHEEAKRVLGYKTRKNQRRSGAPRGRDSSQTRTTSLTRGGRFQGNGYRERGKGQKARASRRGPSTRKEKDDRKREPWDTNKRRRKGDVRKNGRRVEQPLARMNHGDQVRRTPGTTGGRSPDAGSEPK